MSRHHNGCILLFAKSPVKGQVKTRLAAEIGEDFALRLYKCFVEDELDVIDGVGVPVRLLFYPPDAESDFAEWLGKRDVLRPQRGNDLGDRMKNALTDAFAEGFSKAVVIGSDLPDIPGDFLREALKALESHDAVIGPSSDGGYYLIGFSRVSFLPKVFADIAWGTSAVCAQTLALFEKHRRSVRLLPEWHDVDTAEDLDLLLRRNGGTTFESSRTCRYLRARRLRSESNV